MGGVGRLTSDKCKISMGHGLSVDEGFFEIAKTGGVRVSFLQERLVFLKKAL
jgi:hypothetical protein